MALKISQLTAGDVANLVATTSGIEVSNLFTTVPATLRYTFGQIAQWMRAVGFATAIAAAASPAAIGWVFGNALGVDNAAGAFTLTAPLSTGAATPADLIFQTGVVGASSATLQTATTGLTLTSSGAVPVANFAGVVGIGTAGLAQNSLRIAGSMTAVGGAAVGVQLTSGMTLVASANSDALTRFAINGALTPGAFTGVTFVGLNILAASVAGFTSPADPTMLNIAALTGTGATNAYGIRIAPPTGAGTNYLISHTTAATFNVLASGAITTASTITAGAAVTITSTFGTSTVAQSLRNNSNPAAANIAEQDFWVSNSFGGQEKVAAIRATNPNATGNNGGSLVFAVSLNGTATTPTAALTILNDKAATFAGALAVAGAFGCNAATAQTAFASGGALNAYGAGVNGFDTAGNASALYAMVVALRAALVANGIMS